MISYFTAMFSLFSYINFKNIYYCFPICSLYYFYLTMHTYSSLVNLTILYYLYLHYSAFSASTWEEIWFPWSCSPLKLSMHVVLLVTMSYFIYFQLLTDYIYLLLSFLDIP